LSNRLQLWAGNLGFILPMVDEARITRSLQFCKSRSRRRSQTPRRTNRSGFHRHASPERQKFRPRRHYQRPKNWSLILPMGVQVRITRILPPRERPFGVGRGSRTRRSWSASPGEADASINSSSPSLATGRSGAQVSSTKFPPPNRDSSEPSFHRMETRYNRKESFQESEGFRYSPKKYLIRRLHPDLDT
jgi:hypothetical protein